MKVLRISFAIVFMFTLLCATAFAGDEVFKNYVVRAEETLKNFAKQNLDDQTLLPELLKFNNINVIDFDLNKAKFADLGLKDGDSFLIPSGDVLKSIKRIKNEADKNEHIQKLKKIRLSSFYVKIGELKNKMKEGGKLTERTDKDAPAKK